MDRRAVEVKVKPHSYQPTRKELEKGIGTPETTPEDLAKSILRPVVMQEEAVEQRWQRPRE